MPPCIPSLPKKSWPSSTANSPPTARNLSPLTSNNAPDVGRLESRCEPPRERWQLGPLKLPDALMNVTFSETPGRSHREENQIAVFLCSAACCPPRGCGLPPYLLLLHSPRSSAFCTICART